MTPIMIDEMIDEFSHEEHQTAISRALKAIGVPITWDPNDEGELILVILSEDDEEIADYFENDEFMAALDKQYKWMCATRVMDEMTEDGTIEPIGVDEEGHVKYALAPTAVI